MSRVVDITDREAVDRLRLCEEVAGDHRDVGCGEAGEESGLPRVVTDEMEVGEVEHGEGPLDPHR